MRKKCFLSLFRILIFSCFIVVEASAGLSILTLKQNQNGTKQKQNKKEAKNFLLRSKWSETEAKNCHYFRFEVKLSETKAKSCHPFRFEAKQKRNLFRFDAKKVFFHLFSHLKQNKNEMKRKPNSKEAKQKLFGSETKQKYALLISLWSKAKNLKRKAKKNIFRVSVRNACETDLVSLWSENKFFAKPAHPTLATWQRNLM